MRLDLELATVLPTWPTRRAGQGIVFFVEAVSCRRGAWVFLTAARTVVLQARREDSAHLARALPLLTGVPGRGLVGTGEAGA